MPNDIWPEFDVSPSKSSPKTIVELAGSDLERKTKGLVSFYTMGKGIDGDIASLTFSLYSRTLGYHYPFLKVRFPVADGYPVDLVADKIPETLHATNEEELLKALERVFKSAGTIDIVQKLIALS